MLKPTGTMFVDLGDSYSGGKGSSSGYYREEEDEERETLQKKQHYLGGQGITRPSDGKIGIPPKSLCLIPYRFAIAMIDRGWICRNMIIWHKRNCMPSSAKDRFTVDFEPVFFFVKSKKYWFEQQYDAQIDWGLRDRTDGKYRKENLHSETGLTGKLNPQGRNRRCVWDVPTQPYSEAHFATFPEDLVEPMIRAGCPKEICVKCGKAREKILDISYRNDTTIDGRPAIGNDRKGRKEQGAMNFSSGVRTRKIVNEIGLTDCGCNAGFRSGIVLDPFCGSGTAIKVAEKLQRKGIGIDLGYQELSEKRRKWNQVEMMV